MQQGYSVRQLAERAHVSYPTITRIERGAMSPTVAMLAKLARALKVHITELFPKPSGR
jgi:transcriptional regulator with XRE-family HTH domain